MEFPFLSIIALSPIFFAIVILMLPKDRGENARMLGLAAMVLGLILSIYVYVATYQSLPPAGTPWSETLRFVEEHPWVPSIGLNYIVGVDGLSATLVLLTAIVGLGGVLISWSIDDRPREFYAFFMLLVAGVHGVFVAVDGFLLFFFYELAVLPMYVMIAVWGWKERREYASMKLTLYLLIGSFISFISFLVLYFTPVEGGEALQTFDLRIWSQATFPFDIQRIWFMPLFLGFGVLAGLWPFHNWSPDGHVAAPTAVSMIHAGVLMKLGAYASMRVGIQLLPEGGVYWLPFILLLTLINVVYGALIAMRQKDLKYMIGYSSVSHMGLVSMGFAAMVLVGFTGAGIQMVSHGVMTALFFAVVGMIYDRTHTRNMDDLSGMRKALPWTVVAFIIAGLVGMGMPGLSGFLAEFPIFLGVWEGRGLDLTAVFGLNPSNYYGIVAIIAILGIVITAAYILRAIHSVFFGEYEGEKWHDMRPLLAIDKFTLVMFSVILVVIGLFPMVIAPIVESGMAPVADRLHVAQQAAQFHGGTITGAAQQMIQIVAANVMAWLGGA
ncbi:MAG TPA: NADH-quinone oxidoreductase subunit M [Promineifilum sp.]|nr:NADH-quinone oxidoreductase subunit M [Promineifilum sp.]HRO22845.1 NADH-quinone oxidoreductase subunit M [Promineifilum sp.]HRO89754.1 NADH-quinone oxidoreductase subunit M [Promineifilum sp.]HRQ13339.1 NADH-quinone oxidoreductase subunit M [Promineifilum sp.]